MTSSLARQLAQGTSLNSALLVDRSRRKPTQSYLFTSREADQHDLDSIHALAVNGFQRLKQVAPGLSQYEDFLFSDNAKGIDRTLQTADANVKLDAAINGFLPLLGPHLLETPTTKVIEWLVRRFRIHEFNVEAVIAVFLPYHESPHFAKMLSILHISEQSEFSPLLPFKSTASPLSHTALVDIISERLNSGLARFLGSLLPYAIRTDSHNILHRGLVAFHAGVMMEYVKKSRIAPNGEALDEGTLAWILEAAMEPLHICSSQEFKTGGRAIVAEAILSCYLLLSALSHTCSLSADALSAILKAVASCSRYVSPTQLLRTLAGICAAQAYVSEDVVSKSIVKTVIKLDGIDQELANILKYVGTEKFVAPLIKGFLGRLIEERTIMVLTAMVTSNDLPRPILHVIADGLITQSLQGDEGVVQARRRSLLVHLQQRHPVALQDVFQTILNDPSTERSSVEQLLLSLSVRLTDSAGGTASLEGGEVDLLLATTHADPAVRASAIRGLYVRMSQEGFGAPDLGSVRSALLSRVQDTSSSVLEALYSDPNRLLPIVLTEDSEYVSSVAQVLHSQPAAPTKAVMKAHLSFVIFHLYAAASATHEPSAFKSQIFEHVLSPLLLFSKPRHKTAALVWELLESREKADPGLAEDGLLGGCVEAVRWEEGKAGDDLRDSAETMANVNIALATKLAENMLSSKEFDSHLKFVLSRLQGENVYARALAYLTCRALLTQLSGEQRINVGYNVLKATGLTSLEHMDNFMRGAEDLQVFLRDLSLSMAVVLKPTKRHTLERLQVAIISILSSVPRPAGMSLHWLISDPPKDPISSHNVISTCYIELQRSLYNLANSSASLPAVSTHLIQAQLANMGEDALQFLASIWLRHANVAFDVAQFAALRHAAAYLEAYFATQRFVDFQVILPAILVATSHSDRRIRQAAFECVAVLVRLSQAKKPSSIYAFDKIYGPDSAELQYLDWPDLCKYVQTLQQSRIHILSDPSYMFIMHQEHLTTSKADGKKDAGYKERVLSYLLSHVKSRSPEAIKLVVLRSLRNVSHGAKSETLLPYLDKIFTSEALETETQREISLLLLASAEETAVKSLNDNTSPLWSTYTRVVHHCFQLGSIPEFRATIGHGLQTGLFMKLRTERKVELCKIILDLGQQTVDNASMCRNLLSSLALEVPVIVSLLTSLKPSSPEAVQRLPKRPRIDNDVVRDSYASLTLLAEILGTPSLSSSPDLVAALLDTLNNTIHDSSIYVSDKAYIEQLLLSALENAVSKITLGTPLPTVRIDTLVELIRISENPQTFHQALLLLASFAKLIPEAIVQTIMPVFTFMGSNVFHRDDTYSFKVVQKTIENIVPVMILSLKRAHQSKLDLQIASRDFLRVFVDAAHHIPRHRRVSFFTHLVDVLGPEDFLSVLCVLLVGKVSHKVVRQTPDNILVSLSLPLDILQRSDASLLVPTLVEVVRECQRQLEVGLQIDQGIQTLLDLPVDDEHGGPSVTPKKQAQALINFVSLALQQAASNPKSSHASTSSLLAVLLEVTVIKEDTAQGAFADPIVAFARTAIRDTLRIMSAKEFVLGALKVLESEKPTMQCCALEILTEQLSNVNDLNRQALRPAIMNIVEIIKKILQSSPVDTLIEATMNALKSITSTMSTGEEYNLTSTVPLVITLVHQRKSPPSSLNTLLTLSQKLGPRIIPFFKDIVKECVGVLEEEDSHAHAESISVLHALLSSIPNFWSSGDFLLVVELYLRQHTSASQQRRTQLATFVKALAKRAPSKILLPTMCDLWTRLATENHSVERVSGFLYTLRRVIQQADKAILSDYLRALFKTFLDIFQLCASRSDMQASVEADSVSTFVEMVVKMNEATFKPLFRKLFDWAFTTSESSGRRKTVFLHLHIALLDFFKSLVTPYMAFLLQPIVELLGEFKKSSNDTELWLSTIHVLTKSFVHDEGAFWREDKLRQLIAPLVAQLPACLDANTAEMKDSLKECSIALAEVMNDPSSLKTLNLELLMHTRSDEARLRIYALSCSEALWRSHGEKLIGYASETATFVAECAEDDNDSVVREAHRLKSAVESIAGRIDV